MREANMIADKLKRAFESAGKNHKDVILYCRVTPQVAEALDELAKTQQITRSEVIRILLQSAIEELSSAK